MVEDTRPPIDYMQRTKDYYLGLGYGNPYQWACFDEVPFTKPVKKLSEMRIAIVTTAAPYQPDKGDQGPSAPYNAAAKFFSVYRLPIEPKPDLRISHIAIDRVHTSAKDSATFLPLAALRRAQRLGKLGNVAPHIYGFPTNRSQRTNMDIDCPQLIRQLQKDQIEAIIGVPNCPVCHQSVSLAARAAEAAGIASVIMGCALDIAGHVGVPRFYFSDFPLGNSCGRPDDVASQDQTLQGALDLLATAEKPRTIWHSPLRWHGPENWKDDYANITKLSKQEIACRRADFDNAKQAAKSSKEQAGAPNLASPPDRA